MLHYAPQLCEYRDVLSSPNNILGIEYIKALLRLNSSIKPVSIKRVGAAYHEQALGESFPSATAIRQIIHNAQIGSLETAADWIGQLFDHMPESTLSILQDVCKVIKPMNMDDFSQLLFSVYFLMCKAQKR